MNQCNFVTRKLFIKNMLGRCCIVVIQQIFAKNDIAINDIRPGCVVVSFDTNKINLEIIDKILLEYGMSIIISRERQIIESIKTTVFELIHEMNNVDSIIRKSDYLVEKLNFNYRYLSKLFSDYEPITLEKYIILHKIERTKELIDSDEYTLSEIAYMMDYSSVQYLSNQFKKETGLSVTEYKQSDKRTKKLLDEIY